MMMMMMIVSKPDDKGQQTSLKQFNQLGTS